MSPTIKNVAEKAGVSLSTVSLVINNKANVSAKTKKKVEAAVSELNYHPRRNARGLASKKTFNIGFILTDDHFSSAEPFYTKIFLGTEFEARQYNYYILLTTVKKTFKTRESIPRFLLEKNVDGVILAGKVPSKLIDYVQQMELPLVLVDYFTRASRTSRVLIDNYQGGCLAVDHLVQNGHRNIAFIGGDSSHPSIGERLQAYKECLKKHGLSGAEELVSCCEPYTGVNDGYEATQKLLARAVPFTAIFASNDTMAIGAMQCLRQRNLKVPRDVSIVGFDDIEVCLQVEPHLTTIRVSKEELGAIAVRRIVEMIENKKMMVDRISVPVELVVRESTARVVGKQSALN
ncbi:MAG: LacI family DNA-binding transcriptional regulator [bacterium]